MQQVTNDVIASASVTPSKLTQPFTLGSALLSTTGTAIDFTPIPSWVKVISISFNEVSTNGTSNYLVQLGSGSIQTTGYKAFGIVAGGANVASGTTSTAGMVISSGQASNLFYGQMTLCLVSGNTWVSSHTLGLNQAGTYYAVSGGGNVSLVGALDRLRITTANGTDVFDAGSINIQYEG